MGQDATQRLDPTPPRIGSGPSAQLVERDFLSVQGRIRDHNGFDETQSRAQLGDRSHSRRCRHPMCLHDVTETELAAANTHSCAT
jgi:hypothetical protein